MRDLRLLAGDISTSRDVLMMEGQMIGTIVRPGDPRNPTAESYFDPFQDAQHHMLYAARELRAIADQLEARDAQDVR